MVVDRGREALDVVVQDEDVQEVPALVEQDGDVPGGGHEREGRDRGRREDLAQPPPLARGEQVAAEHERGQEEPERALGECRQAGRSRGRDDREAPGDAGQAEAGEADRHRHRGREQHVHGRGAAVGEGQERRPGHEPGVEARRLPVEARAEEGGRPDQQQGGEHRGEPGRGFRLAEDGECGAREPVEERGLLEPRLALERGGHPLAGPVHLHRDPGVAGLVRPEERHRPEAEGEEGKDEGEEHRGRAGREAVRHHAES